MLAQGFIIVGHWMLPTPAQIAGIVLVFIVAGVRVVTGEWLLDN